jgi:NADH-quinone oxidoreductase subunit G
MTTATKTATLTIDGRAVPIDGERNLLELVRKAGIDLPTFCYHSELSTFGACRLCLVDIEGRGIQGACSTPVEPGLKIRTKTEELREIRRISVELLLANHDQSCPTCPKSGTCQLQDLARRLGIQKVRFKSVHQPEAVDRSSPALVRDPNKCVLCGDCVRFCSEVQGIGAIDLAYRGHQAAVLPAFGKNMGDVECINCGQCAAICPTGALSPASEVDEVWKAINDPTKTVVAQIAPAVRVAISESFGTTYGVNTIGQIVAAMKQMGFDLVYDTSFSADLTIYEETTEFLQRTARGGTLPLFTSCCPGWVKFAEQYFPQLLDNLSTCRSPQQMLGSLIKDTMPQSLGKPRKDVVVVSIMPCTAKKFEARRPEFATDGSPDVDYVLTTQELARMIEETGLKPARLDPQSFDMPMGFKTGAGVIFGNSGGVTEAVLRFAAEKVTGKKLESCDFHEVRGDDGLRLVTVPVGGGELKLAVVHGLKNARQVAEQILAGTLKVDIVEVMACPGGCIGGAGQPVSLERQQIRRQRTKALYDTDKMLDLHKSQDNHYVDELYRKHLGEVGGEKAHHLLHTHYHSRRRIDGEEISLADTKPGQKVPVKVCIGTSCFLRRSQGVLHDLMEHVEDKGVSDRVDISGSFCFEHCGKGPTVSVGGQLIEQCTAARAIEAIEKKL